jgi:hypothetical protein
VEGSTAAEAAEAVAAKLSLLKILSHPDGATLSGFLFACTSSLFLTGNHGAFP